MPDSIYLRRAELLLRLLPLILREDVFALKGGTAINFFWRDFPRLSVDIDLAYVKIQDRDLSLMDISDRLAAIESRVQRVFPEIRITQQRDNGRIRGLIINNDDAVVKIEVNTVIRGTVFPVAKRRLCTRAEKQFELSLSANTLSFEDLYGGKICAALERQHPRDLFDIKLLLENEGITENIRKSFIIYLISHSRPIVEVLNPGLQDIKQLFENEFSGMPTIDVTLDELLDVRKELINDIKTSLKEDEVQFILSFKKKKPKWDLLGLNNIEVLPSIRWKLINLERMPLEKHAEAYKKLEEYLLR
jgi:predicted nucleotidyltransferase component of viral defense system